MIIYIIYIYIDIKYFFCFANLIFKIKIDFIVKLHHFLSSGYHVYLISFLKTSPDGRIVFLVYLIPIFIFSFQKQSWNRNTEKPERGKKKTKQTKSLTQKIVFNHGMVFNFWFYFGEKKPKIKYLFLNHPSKQDSYFSIILLLSSFFIF